MKPSERMYNGQVEITDLIGEAVSNAKARRKQASNSEECLSQLSDEQSGTVTGGSSVSPLKFPGPIITVGLWADPLPSIEYE